MTASIIREGIPSGDDRNREGVSIQLSAGSVSRAFITDTDSNGVFTIDVTGLPWGPARIWIKGKRSLAIKAEVTVGPVAGPSIPLLGKLSAGDANGDNVVDIQDWDIYQHTAGSVCGAATYDARADFDANCRVDAVDGSLLKANFGKAGAPRD